MTKVSTLSGGTFEFFESADGNIWARVQDGQGHRQYRLQVKVTDQEATEMRDSLTQLLGRRRRARASRRRPSGSL